MDTSVFQIKQADKLPFFRIFIDKNWFLNEKSLQGRIDYIKMYVIGFKIIIYRKVEGNGSDHKYYRAVN